MDLAIEINNDFPSIMVDYDSIMYVNPELSDENFDKLIKNYRKFLSLLYNENNSISYDFSGNYNVLNLPKNYNSLKGYVELIRKVITYLEENNIPWCMGDLCFEFRDYYNTGIISFNKESKIIKVYYVDYKIDKLTKVKILIGKLNKI